MDKTDADKQKFIESLIRTGQAAKPGPDGELPPGATHELVETDHGLDVIRRRFAGFAPSVGRLPKRKS